MLVKNFQQTTYWFCLIFPQENRIWHFMHTVSQGDNLHERSILFSEKKKKQTKKNKKKTMKTNIIDFRLHKYLPIMQNLKLSLPPFGCIFHHMIKQRVKLKKNQNSKREYPLQSGHCMRLVKRFTEPDKGSSHKILSLFFYQNILMVLIRIASTRRFQ